jgi:hypothetical protein
MPSEAFDISEFDVDEEGFFATEEDAEAARDFNPTEDINETNYEEWEDGEDYDELLGECKNFNPKPKDWKHVPPTQIPDVTFDMARTKFWEHGKKEIQFIRQKIESSFTPNSTTATDQIVTFLAGPDSDLFHAYKKIVRDATYSDFAEWLGAFFFSCHMGQNYKKLSDKNRIDSSDFADAKDYNHVWSIEIANVTKNDQLYSLKHSVST